jgi:NAD(P)-dependent dehydrogenase (short-subunit alcohol dehydrogenase family)/acyl carrier protein
LAATAVVQALMAHDEPELAVRGEQLLAPRLVRAAVSADQAEPVGVPQDGTVLVTGGLGALGFHAARYLAERGVKRLLLTSRRGPEDARAAEVVSELEALGAEVTVAACDVSDRSSLADLLSSVPRSAPLRGVAHCAGLLDDGVLEHQTAERLAAVMAPKVWGAWHLHELTRDLPLDLFVLYSSVAGVVGNPGQSNYAAANAFLDQLAHQRRAQGLRACSLSWGAWSGGGMASKNVDLSRMAREGFDALTPERGIALLETALGHSAAHQVPWALQLKRVARSVSAGGSVPALWRALVRPPVGRRGEQAVSLQDLLAPLSDKERRARVAEMVRDLAAQVLGEGSAGSVPLDQPLQELGLDSLMAVELRNRLNERLRTRLPATLLFDHSTVDALSEHLLEVLQLEIGRVGDKGLLGVLSRAVEQASVARLEELGVLGALRLLAGLQTAKTAPAAAVSLEDLAEQIDGMGDSELTQLLDNTISRMRSRDDG